MKRILCVLSLSCLMALPMCSFGAKLVVESVQQQPTVVKKCECSKDVKCQCCKQKCKKCIKEQTETSKTNATQFKSDEDR